MNICKLLFASALLSLSLLAAEPPEILLWPSGAPGSEGKTGKEIIESMSGGAERKVSNVHQPSLTPYLPAPEKATGAAVLVIPGGGHRMLAIDHEGYNVGRWLSERGVAAFVLKHRLARETNSTYKIEVESLQDTQRALRLIRSRAQEWGLQPGRLGVMGFSAGGELAALASSRFDAGKPDAADPVDRQSSRPDFQALIYPGNSRSIQPQEGAPPVFLACSCTDRPDISEGLAEVYLRFKKAKVPAELHIYASGGHGFGLREKNRAPAGQWSARFLEWMEDQKFLGPRSASPAAK